MVVPARLRQTILVGLVALLTTGSQQALAHEVTTLPAAPDAWTDGQVLAPTPRAAEGADGLAADTSDRRALWARLGGGERPDQVLPGTPLRPLDVDAALGRDDRGHESVIELVCPEDPGATVFDTADRRQGDFTVPGCPLRIVDVPNPLGSPWLAYDPSDPAHWAFFSLHGEILPNGPTERSRTEQTMTTFTSPNYGTEWVDQPLEAGSTPDDSSGEFASGAFDRSGNIYVGYAWYLTDDANDAIGGEVRLYKAEPVTEDRSVSTAYFFDTPYVYDGQGVGRIHVTRVDPYPFTNRTHLEDTSTGGTNETNETDADDWSWRRGDFADAQGERTDRIVAVWPVQPLGAEGERPAGFIDAAWSSTVQNDTWTRLAEEERIGPCLGTGQPAQFQGVLLVPCVVGPGYEARPRARIGDIDIWRLDPFTGTTAYVGSTGIEGEEPILAVGKDGYMVAVASGWDEEQETGSVRVAFGWYGKVWSPIRADLFEYFHRLVGGVNATSARITAAALLHHDPTIVLVYQERNELGVQPPDPLAFDPNSPPRPREYSKTIITMNECDGILAAAAVPLGDGVMSFHWEAYSRSPGTFNDLQDGLVRFVDPVTNQEYLALLLNDYGSAQYAWIAAEKAGQFCSLVPPPLVGLEAGVPAALESGTGAGQLAGAAIGILASAMVAYLLTVKRRTARTAAVGDE